MFREIVKAILVQVRKKSVFASVLQNLASPCFTTKKGKTLFDALVLNNIFYIRAQKLISFFLKICLKILLVIPELGQFHSSEE